LIGGDNSTEHWGLDRSSMRGKEMCVYMRVLQTSDTGVIAACDPRAAHVYV